MVTFIDYQCSPCKQTNEWLTSLTSATGGKLRIAVKNLPLTFHKAAMKAAILAELASQADRFSSIHSALIRTESLDDRKVERIASESGLSIEKVSTQKLDAAKLQVNQDMKLAEKLRLSGTPSLLLACPDVRVFQVFSRAHVERLLQAN
jgi:protein-disulfide isomerase